MGFSRALFFNEEENRIEKFRPYGLPDPQWLDRVNRQFRARPTPEPVAVPSGDGNGEPSPVPASPEEVERAQEAL